MTLFVRFYLTVISICPKFEASFSCYSSLKLNFTSLNEKDITEKKLAEEVDTLITNEEEVTDRFLFKCCN